MKKKFIVVICFVLCFTLLSAGAILGMAAENQAFSSTASTTNNMVLNSGFEDGTTAWYSIQGCGTGVISVDQTILHSGSYSAKITGRTIGTGTFAYSAYDIEIGKTYVYSAWVYSEIPMWFHLQGSVWANYDYGAQWNTAVGPSVLVEANTWTQLSAEFKMYLDDAGKLYVSCNDGVGMLVQDHTAIGQTNFDVYRNLHHVDFEIGAPENCSSMYVDDVEIYEKEHQYGVNNLAANGDAEEEDISAYITQNGGTIVRSDAGEPAFRGNHSLKFTVENNGSRISLNIAGKFEVGKSYTFSAMCYSTEAQWVNPLASSWGRNVAGNTIWADANGRGFLLEMNTWAKVYQTITFKESNGALYILSDNGLEIQLQNHVNYEDTSEFAALDSVDFRINFMGAGAIVFVDEFTVYETGADESQDPAEEDDSDKVNLFSNGDLEWGNTRGFNTQGTITIDVQSEVVHGGENAMVISGREQVNDMVFQTLPGKEIRFDEWYRFSAWIRPSTAIWANTIATIWATGQESGSFIWVDAFGEAVLAQADEWVKLDTRYMFGQEEDGRVYITTDGTTKQYAQNWNLEDHPVETTLALNQVDFKINATMEAEIIYADDFRLTCDYEVDKEEIPAPPTGHTGAENTEEMLGQMFSNASFELDFFGTAPSPNGAIWYSTLPGKVEQNVNYSHSGTACAEIYDRTLAVGQFIVNMNTIRVGRMYTYSTYLSARQATKAAAYIEMWGFKLHEDNTMSYTVATYNCEFQEVDNEGWVRFEINFHYEMSEDGEALVLFVGENEVGRCNNITDLSCFAFGFITDENDPNYLTDMYMDSCILQDVTKSDSEDIEDGGVEVKPFEPTDPDNSEETGKAGCGAMVGTHSAIAAIFLISVAAVVGTRKRNNDGD